MNHNPEENEDENSEAVPEWYHHEQEEPVQEFDDLVTVARFGFPYQAHLLAGKLEAEGVMAFVQDENHIAVNPFIANTIGGVRVQVRESQLEQAKEIMKMIDDNITPSDLLQKEINMNGSIYDLVKGICPECGEAAVYLRRADSIATTGAAALTVAVGIPMKLKHDYFCHACRYEWEG